MPVKQLFNFDGVPVAADGSTLLTINVWAETALSEEDKAAYDAAEEARLAAVQEQIDLGNLTIDESNNYIWADGTNTDVVVLPEWEVFFNRYNLENGITFSETRVELE